MNKPVGLPNIRIGPECSELKRTIVSYIIGISAGVLVLSPIIAQLISCAITPSTHEEWAQYCLGKNENEFENCLKQWQEWQKK